MKLTHIIALILALLFCAAVLTACGGDGGNGETRPEATLPALDRPEGASAGGSGTQAEQGTLPASEDGQDGPTVPQGTDAFVPGESKNGEPETGGMTGLTEPAADPSSVPAPPATESRTNPSPKPGTTQEEEDSNENLPAVPPDDEDDSVENLVVDDDEDEDSRQNLG